MNSIEDGPQVLVTDAVKVEANDVVEIPPLSSDAREYLDELRQKIDPTTGYVLRHPGGYETGDSGLSDLLPALTLDCALKSLEWIYRERAFTTRQQCRQYQLIVPGNDLLGIKPCFVREFDGTVHEI